MKIYSLIPILLLSVENNSYGEQGFIHAEDAVKKIFEEKYKLVASFGRGPPALSSVKSE